MAEMKGFIGNPRDPEALFHWVPRFLEHLRVRNYSERTVLGTLVALRLFVEWALDRELEHADQISKPVLDAYQRWLFHYRTDAGKPLAFSSQRWRLQKVKNFFRWLTRENVIPSNPASELEMPRIERRIPRAILSEREVEKVLALADLSDLVGLRDRAIMEVFYSTGIRRTELAGLDLFDLDPARGVLTVRLGKGKKDRVVPIGQRALAWVARYLDDARPHLVAPPELPALFLSERGERLTPNYLTSHMRLYVHGAKLGKTGSCHIFRHSMATLMLEGGADVRLIQEILGHAEMSTTAIYTRVSIRHLKRVHDATHPAAKDDPGTLIAEEVLDPERATDPDHATDPEHATDSGRPRPDLARALPTERELLLSLAAEAADEDPGLAS
jgi:integrase/recombinase XerD